MNRLLRIVGLLILVSVIATKSPSDLKPENNDIKSACTSKTKHQGTAEKIPSPAERSALTNSVDEKKVGKNKCNKDSPKKVRPPKDSPKKRRPEDMTHQEIQDIWVRFGVRMEKAVAGRIQPWLPKVSEILRETKVSENCSASLMDAIKDVTTSETGAWQMFDAWGKIPAGILEYSLSCLGNYEECFRIEIEDENAKFRGKYCLIRHRPVLPPKPVKHLTWFTQVFNITEEEPEEAFDYLVKYIVLQYGRWNRLGICVPANCSTNDIRKLVNAAVIKTGKRIEAHVVNCQTYDPPEWSFHQKVIMTIFGIGIAIALIATQWDFDDQVDAKQEGIIQRFLSKLKGFVSCFSMSKNWDNLFDTNQSKDDISCLHGIRVISLMWIIFGHTFIVWLTESTMNNARKAVKEFREPRTSLVTCIFILTDTFFFMTGLLMMYKHLHKYEKERKVNVLSMIFTRLYRLLPGLVCIVLFTFVWLNISYGPMWYDIVGKEVTKCERNWWATVFFVNNFVERKHSCHDFTWYLASDFQLFIFVFIPTLFAAVRWRRAIIVIFIALIVSGACISGYVINKTGFAPLPITTYVTNDSLSYIMSIVYNPPWLHIVPYAVGMMTGYALYKKRDVKLNIMVRLLILSVSGACFYYILFWFPYHWANNRHNSTEWFTFFGATSQTMFSFALMGVVYLCATGNCGFIDEILSFIAFIPFSRASYGLYLIHLLVIRSRTGLIAKIPYFNAYNMFCEATINTSLSVIFVIPFYLLCEAPLASIRNKYWKETSTDQEVKAKSE